MDCGRYRNWHPFVELEGIPTLGGEIDFAFRNKPDTQRSWRSEAKVTQLEPASKFAFKFGLTGLCTIEQWYAIEKIADGTRVTYGSTYRGALPAVAGRFIRARLLLLHRLPIEQLARGFAQPKVSNREGTAKKPAKPRRGFRGYSR
jgi:hypothetical protein